jgi:hypothetical protein
MVQASIQELAPELSLISRNQRLPRLHHSFCPTTELEAVATNTVGLKPDSRANSIASLGLELLAELEEKALFLGLLA